MDLDDMLGDVETEQPDLAGATIKLEPGIAAGISIYLTQPRQSRHETDVSVLGAGGLAS